jgi:hypothetical protein
MLPLLRSFKVDYRKDVVQESALQFEINRSIGSHRRAFLGRRIEKEILYLALISSSHGLREESKRISKP